jgi:hypothetical protein
MACVQRKVVVRAKSARRTEDKTCAAEIEDHRRLVWLVHFVPQPPHINIRLVGETNL